MYADGYCLRLVDPYQQAILYVRKPGDDHEAVHRFADDDPFFSEVSHWIDTIEDIEEDPENATILSSYEGEQMTLGAGGAVVDCLCRRCQVLRAHLGDPSGQRALRGGEGAGQRQGGSEGGRRCLNLRLVNGSKTVFWICCKSIEPTVADGVHVTDINAIDPRRDEATSIVVALREGSLSSTLQPLKAVSGERPVEKLGYRIL